MTDIQLTAGLGFTILSDTQYTLAMGATVPVLQLVARSYHRSISLLYGLDGAGAGALLPTSGLLPEPGVASTCAAVAAINACVCQAASALPPGRSGALPRPSRSS